MVTIKDFLGALAVGVNQSRVLADLESANIARSYAADDLLKHFSIPRFRIDDVTLQIPLAIESLGRKLADDQPPLEREKVKELVFRTFRELAPMDTLDERHKKTLDRYFDLKVELLEMELKQGQNKELSLQFFSSSLVSELLVFLSLQDWPEQSGRDLPSLKRNMEENLLVRLNRLIQDPKEVIDLEQTQVIVEAARLKDIRPENLIQIKLTLREEGLEWQTMEGDDGEIKSKLLPE